MEESFKEFLERQIPKEMEQASNKGELVIYFHKDRDGNNIPFMFGTGLSLLFDKKDWEKINNDFPETINNLYALVQGVVFKLDSKVVADKLR